MRYLIQIVLCVVVYSCALFSQDEVPTKITNQNRTGDLPYSSSIGTEIEHVDLATGALNVHIPLWSVPGRGMNSGLSYNWNSNYLVASPRTDSLGNPYYTYLIAKNSGWQTNHTLMTNALLSVQCNGLTRHWGANYMYYDEEGGKHQMAMQTGGASNLCLSPATLNNPDLTAAGIVGNGSEHGVLLPDGTVVNTSAGSFEDANGNTRSLTLPPAGQPATSTDTLGRPLFTAVEGPLDPVGRPTQTTYTVKDANGVSQNITIVWAALNVTTSFATPGVFELQGKEWWAIQSITLPNGTAYHFQYEPDYGELKEIDLPTGGVITYTWANYTYPNPANSIPASESRRYVSSRTETVNGVSNTWNFQLTSLAVGKDQSVVTYPPVASLPSGTVQNQSVFISTNGNVTDARMYSGTATGTPLREYSMVYQFDADPTDPAYGGCFDSTANGMPMGARLTRIITILDNGSATKKEFDYDSFTYTYYPNNGCTTIISPVQFTASRGNVTAIREYGFGTVTGAPGDTSRDVTGAQLLRSTTRTYLHDSSPNYVPRNIVSKVLSEVVVDNTSGTTVSQTQYDYDQTAILSTTNLSAVPAHDSTFTSSFTLRGNPTAAKHWNNVNNSFIPTTYNYDDLGNIRSVIDPLGHTTSWLYDDSFDSATNSCAPSSNSYAYVSKKIDAANHNFLVKRRACTGQIHSHQNDNDIANGVFSTFTYDMMGRLLVTTLPDGGTTSNDYHSDALPPTTTTTKLISSGVNFVQDVKRDGLNRNTQVISYMPLCAVSVDTSYDAIGHIASVSNPHCPTVSSTDGTTSFVYDAIGRTLQTTKQDGSISSASYSGVCTTATDESGKKRKTCSDALGRLINVWEDPAGLNYETDYQYDALGNLLRVDQKGSAPTDNTKWRTRLFTYDSLSRLLTATNPESGAISYTYDNDSNLINKTSPQATQTGTATTTFTYCYDVLHRLLAKGYVNSPNAPQQCTSAPPWLLSPTVVNAYDQGTNGIGHLTSMTDLAGAATYSYDSVGHTIQEQRTANGTTATIIAGYNFASNLTSLTYPDGRLVSYQYNVGDQLNQVQFVSWNGTAVGYNYWSVNNANFFPNGVPKLVSLGNGVSQSAVLNPRLQLQQETATNSALGTLADHVYSYGTPNNGNLLSVTDQLNSGKTQNFTYDSLNRLATAGESGGRWGLGFGYDSWGNFLQQNLTAGSASTHLNTVDANNRLVGFGYDAAGNLITDSTPGHTMNYTYDTENRITQVNGTAATYAYDGDGNRVRKDVPGTSTQYVYFAGNAIAEKNITTGDWSDYIFVNGARIARALALDNGLRIYGTRCSACGSQYALFYLQNAAGLANYTIRSGDKLNLTQYQTTGSHGGVVFGFTDGTSTNWNVRDQDGYYLNDDGTQTSGHVRRIDLSSYAGKIIQSVAFNQETDTAAGPFAIIYEQVALFSSDGTVKPIYTGETPSPVSSVSATSGVTGTGSQIDINRNKAIFPTSTTTYYDEDQIGSSTLITAGNGWPVWQSTYVPYGEEYIPQIIDGEHYKFAGKERDAESGLDYFGARYYGSSMGRFMTPDWDSKPQVVPYANLNDPQSLNLYSYVLNNPMSKADPNGHDWFNVDGKWQWQKGHVYHDANGNPTKAKGYAGLLVAEKTGTNKEGAATYKLTLYDQNKVVATGTGFSGNSNYADTPPIKDGNYQVLGRFDPPPTAPNPASRDNNPPTVYGYQKIDPTLGAYANAVYQAYGPMRARLNPLDPGGTAGAYFHGQFGDAFHSEGWTHGCLSYGRDTTMINYMADHFGSSWTGVSVDTSVVKPQ